MEQGTVKEITNAGVKCDTNKDYSNMFDSIFDAESAEETEDGDKDDYCMRKYVVDNQLIDAKYRVKLNPKYIDISELNCKPIQAKIIKSLDDVFTQGMLTSDDITSEITICAKEKMHSNKVFDKIISLLILKELALTDEQKNVERQAFVDLMTKVKIDIRQYCIIE